ncbi:peptidoglycan-binding protein [Nakamurella sp.]|uniref:peptidoglycan-binding protein n=1 Tax=Nakamurella sp. TaxID=1869182 RepID=UPI003782E78C
MPAEPGEPPGGFLADVLRPVAASVDPDAPTAADTRTDGATPAPEGPPAATGSGRPWLAGRRAILIVAIVAVVMATGGFLAATLIVSPEDAAARAAPPAARPVTVAVESKRLESTVVTRGDIAFSESVDVKLTAATGTTAVVTGRLPQVGQDVTAGTVVVEVTGRPVIALSGPIPAYRTLTGGATGPDVTQLETTLAGMGFDPGPQDGRYDAATAAAVTALYGSLQYAPPAAEADLQAAVTAAEQQEATARGAVAEAARALETARAGPPQSTRISLQAAVDDAATALARAQDPGPPDAAAVEQATARWTAADSGMRMAQQDLEVARQSGGDVGAAEAAAGQAAAELDAARRALDQANTPATPDQAAIAAARTQLAMATALRDEGLATDTAAARSGLDAANTQLQQATDALAAARDAAITPFPAAEVVWLGGLPRRVDEVLTALGSTVSGAFLRVSAADLTVRARVTAEEAGLLRPGMTAELVVRGLPPMTGTVTTVGTPAANDAGSTSGAGSDGGSGSSGGSGGSSGAAAGSREVTLQPQNVPTDQAVALRGQNARVTIPVAGTADDVLVVPLAALFTEASGATSIEIAQDDGVTTRRQTVKVGLSAGGEAEITPINESGAPVPPGPDTLDVGDLVVVGR